MVLCVLSEGFHKIRNKTKRGRLRQAEAGEESHSLFLIVFRKKSVEEVVFSEVESPAIKQILSDTDRAPNDFVRALLGLCHFPLDFCLSGLHLATDFTGRWEEGGKHV